jgi:hypothetical protein
MADQITLVKQQYNKAQYNKVIDNNFNQLVQPVDITQPIVPNADNISVQQFFDYYQQLFYIIPKFGDINSHQYLITTSTEYIGGTTQNDDLVQSLLEEVTQLRQENLDLQQQIVDITKTT